MSKTIQYSDEYMIEQLAELYKNYGDTTRETVNSCDEIPNYSTYIKRFGSIENARDKANVSRRKYTAGVATERVKELFRKLEREGTRINGDTIDSSISTEVRKSDKTVTELRQEAGLIRDHKRTEDVFNRSRIEMIEELRQLESPVSNTEMGKKTKYSTNQYSYTFESLKQAKSMAGLDCVSPNHSDFWYRLVGIGNIQDALQSIDGYIEEANYYVYRLQFDNECFYIGATNNLARRMSESEYWPKDNPQDIYVESFEDKNDCEERETELTFETAIEFKTNDVYGGHHPYSP